MAEMKKFFDLSGKVAVVTGAARGIGRAAATALSAAGADIAGIDIAGPVSRTLDYAPASEADLAETGRAVEALDRRWVACQVDQRDFSGLRDAAARIEQEFGGFDILFDISLAAFFARAVGIAETIRQKIPETEDVRSSAGPSR